jgi:hypothetical protein
MQVVDKHLGVAVLGMNQKHILFCPKFLVFSTSYLPQIFSLLPTSLPPTSPLQPISFHFALISSSKLEAKAPSLKLESTWSGSHHRQDLGTLEARATIIKTRERLKWEPPLSELRSTWSKNHHRQSSGVLEVGATIIRAWECLKWNPKLIGQSGSLKVNSLP